MLMADLDSFRFVQFNLQLPLNLTSQVNQLWSNSLKTLLKQLSEFGVLAVQEEMDTLMTATLVDPVVMLQKLLTLPKDNNSL
jgi:hypothetical protein